MNCGELEKILKECKKNTEIIIFAETENNMYRPFHNIVPRICNKSSFDEKLHLDISIDNEYKSIHFPNNLSKEERDFLEDKKRIILEELEDINTLLKE